MNKTTLGRISDVRMGVTLRGRDATRSAPDGSCRMIRISDLSNDGKLIQKDLLCIAPQESINPALFLRPGDVILPNRGTRTAAHVFDLPMTNVLVGAQFYIIRPKPEVAMPEYVAWFLRGETTAQHLQTRRKGTLVQTLQRRDILELSLPLPPLSEQAAIVALDSLAVQEREISSRLSQLRFIYNQRRLLQSTSTR